MDEPGTVVRMDECEGTLRMHVPPDLREPGGAWVELKRYLPRRLSRDLDWEATEIARDIDDHPAGVDTLSDGRSLNRLSREQWDRREDLYQRMVAARLIHWSYRREDGSPLPCERAALDDLAIPSVHVTAMINACIALDTPIDDEAAFRLRQGAVDSDHGRGDERPANPGPLPTNGRVVVEAGPALPT